MKTKLLLVAAMLLIAWDLKRHYAGARVEELAWILTPTTRLVTVVTGTGFEWRAGEGYFSRDHLFLIEKACAGVNFMIAAFAMLVLALLHRAVNVESAFRVLAGSLVASYLAALVVNTVRIAVALWLGVHPEWIAALRASDAHRLEGIVVYFGGLVLLHELARCVDRRTTDVPIIGSAERHVLGRIGVPLVVYYGITLLVPLVNGAVQGRAAFGKHAVIVLVVPLLAIPVGYFFHALSQGAFWRTNRQRNA